MKILFGFIFVYLIWGTSYLAIKIGVEHLPPIFFCALRYLIAAPLLLLIGRARRETLPNFSGYFWLSLTALLVVVLPGGLIAWGQQYIDSQIAAVLMSSSSFWICLFACLGANGMKISRPAVLGLFVGTSSLLLIIDTNLRAGISQGHAAILSAAIIFSLGTITFRKFVPAHQPATSAGFHLLIGGLVMLVASFTVEASPQWHSAGVAALIYTALANSVLALIIYYWLIHAASPAMVGSPNLVVPVIAITSSALLTNETLSASQLLGAVLMLVALALVIPTSLSTKKHI